MMRGVESYIPVHLSVDKFSRTLISSMCTVFVYPNNIDTSVSHCHVGSAVNDKVLTFSRHGVRVSLAARVCQSVDSTDVVLPVWVHSLLGLSVGQQCEYHATSTIAAPNSQVHLIFTAYQSCWQWSDVLPSTVGFQTPQSWIFDWPEGVNSDVLSSMMPSLLQKSVMTHNGMIAVNVFDLTMIFRVELSGDQYDEGLLSSCPSIEWNSSMQFRISTSDKTTIDADVGAPTASSVSKGYVCYPGIMSRLTDTFHLLVNPTVGLDSRFITKSYLLCAPEGSGKSCLLSQFIDQTQHSAAQSPQLCISSSCSILTPSSTASSISSLNELLSSASEAYTSSKMLSYMKVLMKALAVPETLQASVTQCWSNNHGSSGSSPGGVVIWVIDDLDQVLQQYAGALNAADDNEDSSTATVQLGNEYQIVGYLLHQLLKLLSDHNNESLTLMIIGACRLDVKQIPRAHTGAPEFEKVLSLPRLSADSRQAVLSQLLTDLQGNESGLTLGALPESLLSDGFESTFDRDATPSWSQRLAGLTAGYCPGDLVALIKHTALLHRGKAGMIHHTSGSGTVPCLEWETVVQAMLSLPPKQLQSLGIESSGGAAAGKTQKLSWTDFGGYTDTINLLKRLLSPRNPASLANTSSSTLSPGEVIIPPSNPGGSDFASRMSAVPKGIVLHGPTGCGKTLLARIIASEAKMNFVSIRSTEILSKYFGQTESAIRNLFQKARSAAPCVLFFDEFDAIAYKRGADDEGGNGLHGRVLSTFLNELDGVTSSNDRGFENSVMVLAACADVSTLDEALVRPGRLQYHILLDKPTCEDVQCIIRNQIKSMPVDESVNVPHTATLLMTMRPSCADAEALCQKALFGAIREHINSNNSRTSDTDSSTKLADKKVLQSHFNQALSELTDEVNGAAEVLRFHNACCDKQALTVDSANGSK